MIEKKGVVFIGADGSVRMADWQFSGAQDADPYEGFKAALRSAIDDLRRALYSTPKENIEFAIEEPGIILARNQ